MRTVIDWTLPETVMNCTMVDDAGRDHEMFIRVKGGYITLVRMDGSAPPQRIVHFGRERSHRLPPVMFIREAVRRYFESDGTAILEIPDEKEQ